MWWIAEQQKQGNKVGTTACNNPTHFTIHVRWSLVTFFSLAYLILKQQVYTDHMSNDYVLLLSALCPCVQAKKMALQMKP